MKQILQDLKTGELALQDIPSPRPGSGQLLIRSTTSLISTGTERMLVDFARANLLNKARQQPDRVRQAWEKARTDGLVPTVEAIRSRLDQPLPLGYSNVGRVVAVGAGVSEFSVGDRVLSNGPHAEVVCVPKNLAARIPDEVGDEPAAFGVVGAIALQGIRLAEPTLGEAVVVLGLGLIGQMTVRLLKAHGCRVMAMDPDAAKTAHARNAGVSTVDMVDGEDPIAAARAFSRGLGIDAVIITAATASNEPVAQAAAMCRKRGRIVLVGVVGLELSRDDFYEKELSFQVSCSYGPGRYDPDYEQAGRDYPAGFVRWTGQRNFIAVLDMLADGRLDVSGLVSKRFAFAAARAAYDHLASQKSSLGLLLEYEPVADRDPQYDEDSTVVVSPPPSRSATPRPMSVGFIGSGNHALRHLMPAFNSAGCRFQSVASVTGISGTHAARKFGFIESTTDPRHIIESDQVQVVVVASRHDSHAQYTAQALRAGKHVFVEKPLALSRIALREIADAYGESRGAAVPPILMVGFNRRFAPHVVKARALLAAQGGPMALMMTVNAGALPGDHWILDPLVGGGRIVGEACHFVDLLRFLAGRPITESQAVGFGNDDRTAAAPETATISLKFADGSVGTIHYLANGHRRLVKERLEIFCGGRVLQLNNFRRLRGLGWPDFRRLNLWRQDKGNRACVSAFVDAIESGAAAPIPFAELMEVAQVTLDIAAALNPAPGDEAASG